MEWLPAGLSVYLALLIFSCTIKSRSSFLGLADPGCAGKRAVKRLCVCVAIQSDCAKIPFDSSEIGIRFHLHK